MTITIHHHPTTATGRDWRRAKRPYKMTIHTLQDAFTSWDKHFIRHSPRQRVPDGPPAKNNMSTLDNVSSLWLWCCGCWREVSAPGPRLLLFGFLQWALLLYDDIHPAPLLNDDLHPAVLATIFISIFAPGSLCSCCLSLMFAVLCLWSLACGRVWQVAVIFCGIFSLSARMHAVFLRAFATFLSFSVLCQIQNERKDNMHSHHRNKPTWSKPESAREAPVKVKHPFQRTCVLLAIRRSARISDNTM